jgi:hypothetical protein
VTHLPRLALRVLEPTPAELGLIGEALAARALVRGGARLVARRLRSPIAELDLVFLEGPQGASLLRAVEVKARRHRGPLPPLRPRFPPRAAVDLVRQRRAAARLARVSGAVTWKVELVEVWISPRPARARLVRRLLAEGRLPIP